jgi:hypothetical protein
VPETDWQAVADAAASFLGFENLERKGKHASLKLFLTHNYQEGEVKRLQNWHQGSRLLVRRDICVP